MFGASNVVHMGLLEASLGLLTRNVLGITTHFSGFSSSVKLSASLECFPRVGEEVVGHLPMVAGDVWDAQTSDEPVVHTGVQPQYEAGTNCNGRLGPQKPGTASIVAGSHWTGLGWLLVVSEVCAIADGITPFPPWFNGKTNCGTG